MTDLETQILGMTGCIALARKESEDRLTRCSAITMAFMHACNAATLADGSSRHALKLHDYKHAIRNCIVSMMLGIPFDQPLANLKDWQP